MKSDIVLSEGNSILNIKLKLSFYWKMLLFLRKLNLSNYSLKETLSNEGNWKALLFSLKAILLKRNSLPGCRALRKTTIFLFFFYIFEFLFYENSTWMISCLSLDHSKFYKTLLRDFFYIIWNCLKTLGWFFLRCWVWIFRNIANILWGGAIFPNASGETKSWIDFFYFVSSLKMEFQDK